MGDTGKFFPKPSVRGCQPYFTVLIFFKEETKSWNISKAYVTSLVTDPEISFKIGVESFETEWASGLSDGWIFFLLGEWTFLWIFIGKFDLWSDLRLTEELNETCWNPILNGKCEKFNFKQFLVSNIYTTTNGVWKHSFCPSLIPPVCSPPALAQPPARPH